MEDSKPMVNMNDFKWINKSEATMDEDRLIINALPQSDYFCFSGAKATSGITPESMCNAPFFFTEVAGDFVMKVQVSHDFKDTYDAAALMIMKDFNVWAKACFEYTDFGTHAAVSVVTNHTSDDANGCNIDGNTAWLQVCRVGNSFAFHYSTNNDAYYMMRFFNLPVDETIKVGFVAQSPIGQGGARIYSHISLEKKTVANIRFGK
jgi:uncharacterized protein